MVTIISGHTIKLSPSWWDANRNVLVICRTTGGQTCFKAVAVGLVEHEGELGVVLRTDPKNRIQNDGVILAGTVQ